jgi:hypothetical protein
MAFCSLKKEVSGKPCPKEAKWRITRVDGVILIVCTKHIGPACGGKDRNQSCNVEPIATNAAT